MLQLAKCRHSFLYNVNLTRMLPETTYSPHGQIIKNPRLKNRIPAYPQTHQTLCIRTHIVFHQFVKGSNKLIKMKILFMKE